MLKDRSGHRRNLSQAFIASIDRTALNPMNPPRYLASFTEHNSARETLFLEMFKAGIVSRELTVKILDCVSKVRWNLLSAVHDVRSSAKSERDVKG
ncbi:MAG: hypothetical protein WBQ03_15415 [Candidatus Sulfotelmatobacter sp.]